MRIEGFDVTYLSSYDGLPVKSFACGVEGTVQDREPMVGKWLCAGGWCSWFGNAPYGCK